MPTAHKPATVSLKWYDQRLGALGLAVAAWAAAYYVLLRALDTARNWQYLAFMIFFIYGLNRFVRVIRGR